MRPIPPRASSRRPSAARGGHVLLSRSAPGLRRGAHCPQLTAGPSRGRGNEAASTTSSRDRRRPLFLKRTRRVTASLAKPASRPLKVADTARRGFYAASLNVRRGRAGRPARRDGRAAVQSCGRAVGRWTCVGAVSTGPRSRLKCSQHNSITASARRCGRRRPRQPGAARGAVFESIASRRRLASRLCA